MRAKVRITVLKKLFNEEIANAYTEGGGWSHCEIFSEGREFLSHNIEMPQGFCSWAWADIQKYIMALARGANFVGLKPGVSVTCCTDGIRPVVFLLERI